jgi:hypothetical protein
MAFWRHVLEEMDGFDSVLQSAEDVEFEWRVREAGYAIAYHPAALIWHHPRVQLARYLRQQRHYGRGQAILERRCPERFPLGYRLRNATARLRPRTHRGNAGGCAVSYVTVAHHDRAAVELAHQWGMPLAVGLALTAPLGLVRRRLATPALAAAVFTASLFATDMRLAAEGRRRPDRTLGFIARVAAFRLLRPLAFRWGHLKGWLEFIGAGSKWPPRPGELARQSGTPMEPAPSRARTRRAY